MHPHLPRPTDQRGVALITTLLVMMLMSALLIGFTTVVMSDSRYRLVDRDRARAWYGAHSGLEKLHVELANLFSKTVAPTSAQLAALAASPPSIPETTFVSTGSGAYGVTQLASPPASPITTGPFQGLIALKTLYRLDSTARTSAGGEVHLSRSVETVAIPVFQFGMFSDVDQSFFAGPNFSFGGRIHTNGNLFLAQGGSGTLTLSDRSTAFKQVVRQELANGLTIATSGHTGRVSVATAPSAFRDLQPNEGSVTGGPSSATNPAWPTISLSTYNGYIRNSATGATKLDLALATMGGSNTDIVRRPAVNENVSNPLLLAERFYSKASLRILLSDTVNDIMSLPGVTSTAPVLLDGNWNASPPGGYGPVSGSRPPIAVSPGTHTTVLTTAVATGNNQTITVAAIPPYFMLPPQLRIVKGTDTYIVSCTGRTFNTFTGCTPTPVSVNTPATIEADVMTANGPVLVSTTLFTNKASTSTSIQVPPFSTAPFAPDTFWVMNPNGTNVLVYCPAYTLNTFQACQVNTALQATATLHTGALTNAGVGLIGGYLKIELQDSNNTWRDVTMEILNHGIGAPNIGGKACADPTPNAIIRLQRLRNNAEPNASGPGCFYAGTVFATDYWPNVIFDPREALYRDTSPGSDLYLGGVMHYVELDVANLSNWIKGVGVYNGGSGPLAKSDNGYTVYFSDRRNNRTLTNQETGEFGFEDIVNPASATGTPNGSLDTAEDVNGTNVLDTYGQFPNYNGLANNLPPGSLPPLNATARPTTLVDVPYAMVNRAIFFRRGLKLSNGGVGQIVSPGLTIAAENPVYVHGSWNSSQGNPMNQTHVATAIIADAVTILSDNWSDQRSFDFPYSPGSRPRASNSYYRFAVIAGKNAAFPRPTVGSTPTDFGTDGGAHNFLRMLEGSGGTVHYRGSIATFYFSRQAVGIYKCCSTVYGAPTRNFNFDTDFLDMTKLPPNTPMFRDTNSLGFVQDIRPGL